MDSPTKADKLIPAIQDDDLEIGHDGMPQEIWEDMIKNERKIFYMFMFLNASVLWAYYSCLSAQDFYTVQFANSGLDFSFLTTLCTAWPMVIGQGLQMFFGLDKSVSRDFRVIVGYGVFMLMAVLIMVFSAINFSNEKTGAILVLVCFGCVGFGNSLTEATYYTFAALFPVPKFSQAVQIGNGTAGIINVSLLTILRLAVGGVKQTGDSTKLSFYLFFGLLIVVLIVALFVYYRLNDLPCVKFLVQRNEESMRAENLATQPFTKTCANLWRILRIIWVPALAQFLVFFVSLSVYPGFGCAAARNLKPPYADVTHSVTGNWYCTPGIVGSYNYGDFFGRVMTGAAVYKLLTSNWCLGLSILRLGFIPLLLMGVAGTSLYSFGYDDMGAIAYNIVLNLVIGVTNGFLSTVTMGVAPRMLKPEDRESGGAVMAFCLFFGLSAGSTIGFFFSDQGWLGLLEYTGEQVLNCHLGVPGHLSSLSSLSGSTQPASAGPAWRSVSVPGNMVKNERKIFFMFMFLNGSELWAYYSCLSYQDFYKATVFGLDKKITRQFRVHVGYAIFILFAILIMVFSAINFSSRRLEVTRSSITKTRVHSQRHEEDEEL